MRSVVGGDAPVELDAVAALGLRGLETSRRSAARGPRPSDRRGIARRSGRSCFAPALREAAKDEASRPAPSSEPAHARTASVSDAGMPTFAAHSGQLESTGEADSF